MKRLLLSTALVLGLASTAHAAIPVVDFGSIAQQIKQQRTDLLFIAWAGTTAPATRNHLTS